MKLVTVIIKPFKLEDVREALSSIGIQGLTVTEVKGFGRQKGHAELYRGAEYSVNFLPKVKIDVAIADDQLDEVIDIVSKAAYTGKIGDGKIFVAELQRVYDDLYCSGAVYDYSGDCPVLRWVDSRQKRAVDADAGDGDVCTGLYSLGGLRLLAGVW